MRDWIYTVITLFIILGSFPKDATAQKTQSDPATTTLSLSTGESVPEDTAKIIEDAPLDIGQDRGLFIVTPDQKMQLRILGSVRYLAVYDNVQFNSKNSFNTYYIPISETSNRLPNYYNGLSQTRLGFEITRRTEKGNVFIRLETDFAGAGGFRIRHAYGQINRFLLGQTWSLFSHVAALPSTVDFTGPTGSIVTRTPQVRYTAPNLIGETNFAIGFEYLPPDLDIPDSLQINAFQLIPNITVRADHDFSWGSAQISGILPVLSGRYEDQLRFAPGWGISASCVINSWAKGKWYIQGVGGRAISKYLNDLAGNGFDIQFLPDGGNESPFTYGWYATYEHRWVTKVYSSFTYGMCSLEEKSFTPENIYAYGYTLRFNTFWDITDGAKAGGELIWGDRKNKDGENGNAVRLNMLFYYDF